MNTSGQKAILTICCFGVSCALSGIMDMAHAQTTGIVHATASSNATLRVGEDRLVAAFPQIALVEPHLAIDPEAPAHLIAATAAVLKTDMSAMTCYAFVS